MRGQANDGQTYGLCRLKMIERVGEQRADRPMGLAASPIDLSAPRWSDARGKNEAWKLNLTRGEDERGRGSKTELSKASASRAGAESRNENAWVSF